ncbi:hypothetical protein ACKGJY_07855 [Hyunsoonleella sp. 2307UL5-6]|uniref:hypothetical protein n=1 Tax=Hyunsoonleella sp. 2307UL5-6 TaxID=3384768 RepID=UPI0039BC5468
MLINIEIGALRFKLTLGIKRQKKINSKKTIQLKPKTKLSDNMSLVLNKNLKHLNFIDRLEMNYSQNQLNALPYLEELKRIKLEAQKNTLSVFNTKVA